MTMTKTTITNLVQTFLDSLGDATALSSFYTEVVDEIARSERPPLVDVDVFSVTDGTAEYEMTAYARQLLAVFFEGRELHRATPAELEVYAAAWRTDEDSPIVYTVDEQTSRTFRLYPVPAITTTAYAGDPLDGDFPENGACLLYGSYASSSIPDQIALIIFFSMLARAYSKQSALRDPVAAQLATEIATALTLLGA